eukprot:g19158.t1
MAPEEVRYELRRRFEGLGQDTQDKFAHQQKFRQTVQDIRASLAALHSPASSPEHRGVADRFLTAVLEGQKPVLHLYGLALLFAEAGGSNASTSAAVQQEQFFGAKILLEAARTLPRRSRPGSQAQEGREDGDLLPFLLAACALPISSPTETKLLQALAAVLARLPSTDFATALEAALRKTTAPHPGATTVSPDQLSSHYCVHRQPQDLLCRLSETQVLRLVGNLFGEIEEPMKRFQELPLGIIMLERLRTPILDFVVGCQMVTMVPTEVCPTTAAGGGAVFGNTNGGVTTTTRLAVDVLALFVKHKVNLFGCHFGVAIALAKGCEAQGEPDAAFVELIVDAFALCESGNQLWKQGFGNSMLMESSCGQVWHVPAVAAGGGCSSAAPSSSQPAKLSGTNHPSGEEMVAAVRSDGERRMLGAVLTVLLRSNSTTSPTPSSLASLLWIIAESYTQLLLSKDLGPALLLLASRFFRSQPKNVGELCKIFSHLKELHREEILSTAEIEQLLVGVTDACLDGLVNGFRIWRNVALPQNGDEEEEEDLLSNREVGSDMLADLLDVWVRISPRIVVPKIYNLLAEKVRVQNQSAGATPSAAMDAVNGHTGALPLLACASEIEVVAFLVDCGLVEGSAMYLEDTMMQDTTDSSADEEDSMAAFLRLLEALASVPVQRFHFAGDSSTSFSVCRSLTRHVASAFLKVIPLVGEYTNLKLEIHAVSAAGNNPPAVSAGDLAGGLFESDGRGLFETSLADEASLVKLRNGTDAPNLVSKMLEFLLQTLPFDPVSCANSVREVVATFSEYKNLRKNFDSYVQKVEEIFVGEIFDGGLGVGGSSSSTGKCGDALKVDSALFAAAACICRTWQGESSGTFLRKVHRLMYSSYDNLIALNILDATAIANIDAEVWRGGSTCLGVLTTSQCSDPDCSYAARVRRRDRGYFDPPAAPPMTAAKQQLLTLLVLRRVRTVCFLLTQTENVDGEKISASLFTLLPNDFLDFLCGDRCCSLPVEDLVTTEEGLTRELDLIDLSASVSEWESMVGFCVANSARQLVCTLADVLRLSENRNSRESGVRQLLRSLWKCQNPIFVASILDHLLLGNSSSSSFVTKQLIADATTEELFQSLVKSHLLDLMQKAGESVFSKNPKLLTPICDFVVSWVENSKAGSQAAGGRGNRAKGEVRLGTTRVGGGGLRSRSVSSSTPHRMSHGEEDDAQRTEKHLLASVDPVWVEFVLERIVGFLAELVTTESGVREGGFSSAEKEGLSISYAFSPASRGVEGRGGGGKTGVVYQDHSSVQQVFRSFVSALEKILSCFRRDFCTATSPLPTAGPTAGNTIYSPSPVLRKVVFTILDSYHLWPGVCNGRRNAIFELLQAEWGYGGCFGSLLQEYFAAGFTGLTTAPDARNNPPAGALRNTSTDCKSKWPLRVKAALGRAGSGELLSACFRHLRGPKFSLFLQATAGEWDEEELVNFEMQLQGMGLRVGG